MLPLILPIGAILLGVALLLLGGGLLNTLLTLRASIEGYSDSLIGLIMSGYFIGYFFGTFLALPVIRRVGHIRAFALCAAIMSCTAMLHVIFLNPYAWLALRIITGSALVILYTIIESWLNGQSEPEQRGKVFSIYMVVNLSALALAQQLLVVSSPDSFELFAIAGMLITISLVPVAWTRFQQPHVAVVTRLKFKQLHQIAPVAFAGALLSGFVMGAFWGLGPLYAERSGLEAGDVALFMSCAIIGGAIFQFPLGRYSDTHDRRRVLLVICLTGILASIFLYLGAGNMLLQLVAIALFGGLSFALYPVVVAHLIDFLDAKDILSGVSGLLLLHGMGAAVGPALAGQFMQFFGHHSLPIYFGVFLAILAAYTLFQLSRMTKKQEEPDHPMQFVPMVRTTPTAIEMMPEDPVPEEPEEEPEPEQEDMAAEGRDVDEPAEVSAELGEAAVVATEDTDSPADVEETKPESAK